MSATPSYGWRKPSICFFDSDRCFEVRRVRDIRVRDIEIRLYIEPDETPESVVPHLRYPNFFTLGLYNLTENT